MYAGGEEFDAEGEEIELSMVGVEQKGIARAAA
eukprot:SAG11_NODE_24657_length_370_cov_0.597786_1_plen_32_part_10